MKCPHCGGENHQRIAGRGGVPREVGNYTIRSHKCLDCRSLFISRQEAMDEDDCAEVLESLL